MTPWKKAGLLPSMRWPAKRRIHPVTKSASPMRHHVKIERTIPARMSGIPTPWKILFHGLVCSWSYCAMYLSNEDIECLRDRIYIRCPRGGSKEARRRADGADTKPCPGKRLAGIKLTWVQHGCNVAAIWFARMALLLFRLRGTLAQRKPPCCLLN